MSKIKKQITVEESINRSLLSILNEMRFFGAGKRGVQAHYNGRFVDLKRDCQRIINAIERWEENSG